jgi:multicomponent Na+:H+ antiporter subunit G
MVEIAIMVVSAIGSVFILLAAIGIVRMPDLYLRISVTTKAATLGIGLILTGAALFFADFSVTSRVIAIVFFLLLTAPVGAHMIGRASYFIGTPLWKNSVLDDLKGQYEKDSHTLSSEEQKPGPEDEEGAIKANWNT